MRGSKILAAIAAVTGALVVAVWGSDMILRHQNPFPPLAAGLPENVKEAGHELDRRVKARFPLGSSEASLRAALAQEGWGESQTHNHVRFTRAVSLGMKQTAVIAWQSDEQGRITNISVSYGLIAP